MFQRTPLFPQLWRVYGGIKLSLCGSYLKWKKLTPKSSFSLYRCFPGFSPLRVSGAQRNRERKSIFSARVFKLKRHPRIEFQRELSYTVTIFFNTPSTSSLSQNRVNWSVINNLRSVGECFWCIRKFLGGATPELQLTKEETLVSFWVFLSRCPRYRRRTITIEVLDEWW